MSATELDAEQAEYRRSCRAYMARVVRILDHFEGILRPRMVEGGLTYAVVHKTDRERTYWIWDNGGEVGIELVNSGEIARFVPSRQHGARVHAATVAEWIHQTIRGETPDFDPYTEDARSLAETFDELEPEYAL